MSRSASVTGAIAAAVQGMLAGSWTLEQSQDLNPEILTQNVDFTSWGFTLVSKCLHLVAHSDALERKIEGV